MDEIEDHRADNVYVILKKNYRISRNIRLIWFFNNILKDINNLPAVISKDGEIDDSNGHEIQVLSWSRDFAEVASEPDDQLTDKTEPKCILQPETKVYFLSRGYRLVFALDLSPSVFRIDAGSFRTIAEGILSRLANCLCSLVTPFQVPNSDVELLPNIYVTIFSQTRPSHKSSGRYKQDVIVQGCLLTRQSVASILKAVECKIFHGMKSWSPSNGIETAPSVRHDHGLVSMLRTGLLALQLLPSNTSAGIVVITDGVVGVPDMAVLETLLNQLRSTTTSCSFLHVRSSQAVFCDYAHCVNIELLKFITAATCGTFFGPSDDEYFKTKELNVFQKGLLIWQFQIGDDKDEMSFEGSEKSDIRNWDPETDLRYTPSQKNMHISPILRKKHFEHTLSVSIFALLSVRLREGYMIDAMTLGKNQNLLEVKLIYSWNHAVSIKYIASSAWPVVRNSTKVEVFFEGTYEFLYDIFSGHRQESWNRYRSIATRRFKHFIKGLTQTDHMMTHLQSFNFDPVNYTISQKQIPLFYLPPNSNQLVLSMPSGNDSSKSQFALYWKPIFSLDINIWQKWLHTHHIDIILQHDLPLPKHLHSPTKSGRYHSIQTSSAMSQLTSLLREWCTFILLENHTYVKFTYKENEDKPFSFYIVRLSSKAPVVVIRLAFLIGTPGTYRNQILSELRDRVLALVFPSANKSSLSLTARPTGTRSRNSSAQTRTRHVSGSGRACAILVHKPLDRILIRYDQTPKDFLQPPSSGYRHGKAASAASSRSGHSTGGEVGSTSMMQDLCRYMEHHRCVWSVTNRSMTPLSIAVVGQLANLLVKLRLSEGFNFASTSSGVICMTREFPMTINSDNCNEATYYCMAQFIIFPPTVCTSRESFSLDGSGDDEEDTAEADGELLLSTEMWIEPQCGVVTSDVTPLLTPHGSRHPSGLTESGQGSRFSSVSSTLTTYADGFPSHQKRFTGAKYGDILQTVFDEDHVLLKIIVTIEHLRLMCVPRSCVLSTFPQQGIEATKADIDNDKPRSRKTSSQSHTDGRSSLVGDEETKSTSQSTEGITHFPCLFNLVSLLNHCTRVKLLFMTLYQDVSEFNDDFPSPNTCLFEFFHGSLNNIFDREAVLSENDSESITKHMMKRDGQVNSEDPDGPRKNEGKFSKMKWKCYLKVLPKAKVWVILLPSTFEDLQNFATIVPGLIETDENLASAKEYTAYENTWAGFSRTVSQESNEKQANEKVQIDTTETVSLNRENYRLARRRSIKRMPSLNFNKFTNKKEQDQKESVDEHGPPADKSDKQPQISLPVFMYECTTSSLVEQLTKDPSFSSQNLSDTDIELDYRMTSVDINTEPESTRHRYFRSQSYHYVSNSPNPQNRGFFSPPAEDVFDSSAAALLQQRILDSNSSKLCDTIVDSYHRSFVRAVANNLRLTNGLNVASVDVQAATDAMCVESVREIDITQFLLITCPQVAAFKTQHLNPEMLGRRDHDDVFTLDIGQHGSVGPVQPLIRHKSSTSSTTDPLLSNVCSSQKTMKKSSSESPEQKTRDSKSQVSGISRQNTTDENIQLEDIVNSEVSNRKNGNENIADVHTEKPGKSAFKKLRKRPQSFPKSTNVLGKEVSDGDTPDSEAPSFLAQSGIEPLGKHDIKPGSLPRSLKVAKPFQKLPVVAKVDWDDLPDFPVNLLKESHLRHISGNDDQVQMNFLDLLSQNFSNVKAVPDIFYYNPQDQTVNVNHATEELEPQKENTVDEANEELVTESDLDVKFELGDNDTMAEADLHPEFHDMEGNGNYDRPSEKKKRKRKHPRNFDRLDLTENFGNASDFSSSSSTDSYNDDEINAEKQDVPLFLCMTCAVWDKKTGNHGSMLVDGLPTSLLTVLSSLERPCEQINLSQLCITLDLIWMTLPPEYYDDLFQGVDFQNRFTSGLLPDDEDSPRHERNIMKERILTVHEDTETLDPLSILPASCAEAVDSIKQEIDWLLKDEIISALRTIEKIDSSTLLKVTDHLEGSNKATCMVEIRMLQFVFGSEKSLQLFHSEFERMFKDFKGYRMKKEGEYYYFTTERTFLPIPVWDPSYYGGGFQSINQATDNEDFFTGNSEDVATQQIQSNAGSTSSSGKVVPEVTEINRERNEHLALRRTKTAPNSLRSPPTRMSVPTKSYNSLSLASSIHSNSSFRSLLHNDFMSVDAIESDVAPQESGTNTSIQPSSSQSTPLRKTHSTHGVVSPFFSSPKIENLSPHGRQKCVKYGKVGKSRLSLPNATNNLYQDTKDVLLDSGSNRNKKRFPVKQKSFDGNNGASGKAPLKRHSSHAVTPLSLRNSPQSNTGPTSPLVIGQTSCHNSSFGSASSAPTCRHRSTHNVTPVAQIAQRDSANNSTEPSSSTPMLRYDGGTNVTSAPSAIPNSAYLFAIGGKDAISSPVSLSDGEYRNSTASWFESGYDGEESDLDEDDIHISSLHNSVNDLPSFWLIVRVFTDHVKTYFHRRSSAIVAENVDAEHKRVFTAVNDHILTTCKHVNQVLLLLEMHDSRTCNALLVEETEEDIWRKDYTHDNFGQSEDHGDDMNGALLAAAMTTAPGQFACDCVLERIIHLHPRLRMGGNSGKLSVIPIVRDLVINLMITNRKNMFVYLLADKSVFYCRMEEDFGQHSVKGDSRRSSQLYASNADDFADRRTSRESLTGIGLMELKPGGTLTLRWHGVGPLVPHQKEELEKMNQSIIRKLNDSILEKITVILQRNSKLTSSDVHFIQPSLSPASLVIDGSPNTSRIRPVKPDATLSYGLPNEFQGCISAVNFYLHQNLLQFMAIPRYVDAALTSAQFVSYKMGGNSGGNPEQSQWFNSNDGSVFLFHQSIERGKTGSGIACVVLEITDADGVLVSSDSIPKFDVSKQPDLNELLNLTEVIDMQDLKMNIAGSRSNTPAVVEQSQALPKKDLTSVKTYVRFHLWLKGSLTVEHLNKELRPAVCHSLFDAITEMLILRPPLCNLHVNIKSEDNVAPMEFQKSKQTTSGKTDAMRSILFGSLNDPSSSSSGRGILSNLLYSKLETNAREDLTPKHTTGGKKGNSPFMSDRRKSAGMQAEEGEIGSLREIYRDLSKTWFDAMVKNDCPSAFEFSMDLSTMSQINNALHDMQKIISTIVTDCKAKLFISLSGSEKMVAHNLEQDNGKKSKLPAKYPSYVIVARNLLLWRKAVASFSQPGQQAKTAKFQPYDSTMKPEQSPRPQEIRLVSPFAVYIPRQQFVIVSIQSRSVKVFGYNLSNDTARNLQVKMSHCVDFHNARRRALDCITMQKLSLFRHCMFETGFSTQTDDDKKDTPHVNSFTQDVKDVDLVLLSSKLPTTGNELHSKRRSKPNKKSFFNDAYLTNTPVKPLSVCLYNKGNDFSTKYANQYLEMKARLKKQNEELSILHRVFSNWRERPSATPNLSKDVLPVLLQNTRVVHHVTSPVLFNPHWRKQILKIKFLDKKENDEVEEVKETQVSKRQKRLSGASRKSGDFTGKTLEDAKSRSRSNSTRKQNAKEKGSKGDLVQLASDSLDEIRYEKEELKKALLMHYVQYWQTMHFILVKEEKISKVEKSHRKSSSTDKNDGKQKNPKASFEISNVKLREKPYEKGETNQSSYLYRVSAGGIVIVDISCVEMNFLVKLHVIEASRLQHQQSLKQSMSVLFLNECEHLKDYTHVHSFAFDFHLRYLQMYIQDRQTAIRPGYHIVSLLQDFISFYESPPVCAFNQIFQGSIEAPCSHVLANELYEYIVGKQSSLHGFKTLKLIDNNSPKNQHALVSSHLKCGQMHSHSCNKDEHDMYDVGYVIWHDQNDSVDEKKIKLNFFILFTNRRHLFPRFDRPENLPSNVFPIRRSSSSIPQSSHPHKPTLLFKQLSPTSQSTSSLQKLTEQVISTAVASKTKHLSPINTRKFISAQMEKSSPINNDSIIKTPSRKTLFTPPGPPSFAKRMLLSQGRRQSMPNVGRNISVGARKDKNVNDHGLQSSLGHLLQTPMELLTPHETGLSLFVQCEMARLKVFFTNVCESAEIQCYRNQLWDKVYMDKPSQNKTSMLPVEDFEHLLKHCQKIPLNKLNKRGDILCNVETMSIQWAISLQKHMMTRFDQICRFFTNADSSKRYLGILNPKLYYMMFLITVDAEEKKIGMYVVMRDKQAELEKEEPNLTNTNDNPNLIPLCGHLNNMIDFICYHTWTSLLSS